MKGPILDVTNIKVRYSGLPVLQGVSLTLNAGETVCVVGSNGATFTTPAADLLGSAVGSDFSFPADGPYIIGVVTTATVAVSSLVHMNAHLQIRNA